MQKKHEKTDFIIFTVTVCLSLAVCDNRKPNEHPDTNQGQTTDNSSKDTNKPDNADSKEQVIEITLDNWRKEASPKKIVNVEEGDNRIAFNAQYVDPYACTYLQVNGR